MVGHESEEIAASAHPGFVILIGMDIPTGFAKGRQQDIADGLEPLAGLSTQTR